MPYYGRKENLGHNYGDIVCALQPSPHSPTGDLGDLGDIAGQGLMGRIVNVCILMYICLCGSTHSSGCMVNGLGTTVAH